jgi:hypothetical protein
MKRFVIRTIKNGQVRINQRIFRPDERWLKYDGRLDGMRYAFGLYYGPGNEMKSTVYLWGTEKAYHGDVEQIGRSPEAIDGYYPWAWWREISKGG